MVYLMVLKKELRLAFLSEARMIHSEAVDLAPQCMQWACERAGQ